MMRRNVKHTAIAESVDGSKPGEAAINALEREARLEQLRLEVQAGNYEAPSEELATALIEDGLKGSVLES